MSNWQYAKQVPTDPFRSVMSIPRKLKLRKHNSDLKLVQIPIDLSSLYEKTILQNEDVTIQTVGSKQIELSNLQVMVEAKVKENKSSSFSLTLKGEKEQLQMVFDRLKQEVRVDRTYSGHVSFSEQFVSIDIMPIEECNDIKLMIDKTSIELFVNQGSSVMTELFYPVEQMISLEWNATDGEVMLTNVSIHTLKSTWK
jgi:fructan beta-fructosidase